MTFEEWVEELKKFNIILNDLQYVNRKLNYMNFYVKAWTSRIKDKSLSQEGSCFYIYKIPVEIYREFIKLSKYFTKEREVLDKLNKIKNDF